LWDKGNMIDEEGSLFKQQKQTMFIWSTNAHIHTHHRIYYSRTHTYSRSVIKISSNKIGNKITWNINQVHSFITHILITIFQQCEISFEQCVLYDYIITTYSLLTLKGHWSNSSFILNTKTIVFIICFQRICNPCI
jgi:hypothetical protein